MDLSRLDFRGKSVWVTGAHQGIGREIASSFVSLGADVVGFDRTFLSPEFRGRSAGLPFRTIGMDLALESSVDSGLGEAFATCRGPDALVSAAGILHLGSVESLDPGAWRETLDVNVTGVFHLFQRVAPCFRERKRGAIVAIGSNAAHVPRARMAAYCASKAALTALCKCLALELAPHGVRCNVVSPGSTDTAMQRALWTSDDGARAVIDGNAEDFRLGIPLGKIATATDIANLVVFLASDLAGHIALQDVVIDGGATLGA